MNLFLLGGIVAAAAALGVLLMYLLRRTGESDGFYEEIERGSGIFAFVGTAFAVLLAFVVLEAFENFDNARSSAETEATDVVELSRYADYFSPTDRTRLVATLVCYGRSVAHIEWTLMETGRRSPVVQAWVERFERQLRQVKVRGGARNSRESAAYFRLLETDSARTAARRERLTEAARPLPGPVWFFLILGASLTVGIALLFADRREPFIVQASLMAAACALVTSGLLLVWFLDHPYGFSSGNIKPDEMERLLPIVEHEHPNVRPPCNQTGEPVRSAHLAS